MYFFGYYSYSKVFDVVIIAPEKFLVKWIFKFFNKITIYSENYCYYFIILICLKRIYFKLSNTK